MRSQRANEIKVGIVTFLGVIVLIIGITLGRGYHEAISSRTIKLRFQNSGGIEQSAPVVVNGVKRGIVLSVQSDNGSVLITASINKTDDLKSDATARITILELTGGKKIEIMPGTSDKPFEINQEIIGATPPDLPELVAIFGNISSEAVLLFKRIDTIATNLNLVMNEGNVASINRILTNTEILASNLNELIQNNDKQLELTIQNLKTLSLDIRILISDNKQKINNLVEKFEETTENTNLLIKQTNQTIAKADSMIMDLKDITENIRKGDGLASKLIYDKAFTAQLDTSLKNINELIKQIRKYGVNTNVSFGRKP